MVAPNWGAQAQPHTVQGMVWGPTPAPFLQPSVSSEGILSDHLPQKFKNWQILFHLGGQMGSSH